MEFFDVLKAAKDFGLPVLGAVGGWLVTSYAVRSRVEKLEGSHSDHKTQIESRFARVETDITAKQRELKEALEEKHKELKDQIKELEDQMNKWQRESAHSFASDHELNAFIAEEQRQWQAIQRTLGQIEGMLKKLP